MITRTPLKENEFETTIILDEEKLKDCPYTKEQVDRFLDKMFAVADMTREGDTFKNGTFATMGGVSVSLFQCEWFMKIVKHWTLREIAEGVVITEENVFESEAVRKKYLDKYGI